MCWASSVLWLHIVTCNGVCIVHCVSVYCIQYTVYSARYLFKLYYKFISRRSLNLSRGFCHVTSLLGLPSTMPGQLSNTHLHPARFHNNRVDNVSLSFFNHALPKFRVRPVSPDFRVEADWLKCAAPQS